MACVQEDYLKHLGLFAWRVYGLAAEESVEVGFLLPEVHVALIVPYSLGLRYRSSHSTCAGERVPSRRSTHVIVLALEVLGIESNRLGGCIVDLWDLLLEDGHVCLG